eukprot:TRINITY_DN5542_c0_g2_i1.p2 TRINITY_DN5542_c0_g2~~TRINITY_DN5542_c0_g2_i1.p2  ORF type:complete len:195 (+),score=54.50 TRINITY_DN5542_c0_g2_i1:78-662(+)
MAEEQRAYLRKHNLPVILDGVLLEMLKVKPTEPMKFTVEKLQAALADLEKSQPASKPAEAEEVIDLSKLDKEDREKIVKIQAQYRGGKARQEVKAKKDSAPAEKEPEKAEEKAAGGGDGGGEDAVDISTFSDEDKAKIVKIQAKQRGNMARDAASKKKAGGDGAVAAGAGAESAAPAEAAATTAPTEAPKVPEN